MYQKKGIDFKNGISKQEHINSIINSNNPHILEHLLTLDPLIKFFNLI